MNAIPPGSNPPPAGQPPGLLAVTAQVGVQEEHRTGEEAIKQASSVDPAYQEPSPPQAYVDVLKMFEEPPVTLDGALSDIVGLKILADKLIQRVRNLETALMPLACNAPRVGNARMCAIAEGRAKDPVAGIWVHGVQSIHMTPNETIFYDAADMYGRGRVEKHMADAFEKVSEATEAAKQQAVHIEGGGKLQ